jgi:hypothetical protein
MCDFCIPEAFSGPAPRALLPISRQPSMRFRTALSLGLRRRRLTLSAEGLIVDCLLRAARHRLALSPFRATLTKNTGVGAPAFAPASTRHSPPLLPVRSGREACIFLHFFAFRRNTTPIFSTISKLFAQNTRGWGYGTPRRRFLSSTHAGLFYVLHYSLFTTHCSLPLMQLFFHLGVLRSGSYI